MSWWIMNLIQVGFDCLTDLDTNVKDGYECHDGLWIWYRLGLIVYPIWILMLMIGKNVMIFVLIWILMLKIDTNVKDWYECKGGATNVDIG